MSYQGITCALPLGEDGLTGNQNLSQVRPTELLTAQSIAYDFGTIRKEGGAAKYNASALSGTPRILGGWDWNPVPGSQRMVVYTSAGSILKDAGTGEFSTTLATGLSNTSVPVFAEGGAETLAANRKLFIANGNSAVQVLSGDGATTTALSLPPADWSGASQPSTLCAHDGRMWGGLNHRVYYSTRTNHEDFSDVTNAGSLAIFPGEGEKITQIMSFRGLLIVWKFPVGIYIVDTTDPTVTNWVIRRVSNTLGGVSPHGACQIVNDVLFMDHTSNFQLLSGVQEFGLVGLANLSQTHFFQSFTRLNLNLTRLDQVRSVFYAYKMEAHFACTRTGSVVNDTRIVVDFNRPDFPRFRWSPRDTCESLWLRKDVHNIPRLTSGDDAGFVWNLDQDTFTKDGSGYRSEFQLPHLDLSFVDPSFATKRKNGQFLEVVAEPSGNWNLSADIIWDGVTTQTVTFSMDASGAVLGSFILDTDVLGQGVTVTVRHRITGGGRRLSIRFYNTAADQDFSISRAYLSFTPADESIR